MQESVDKRGQESPIIVSQSVHAYRQAKPGPHQSQHGEDHWIDSYFGGKSNGFFVEVGAYDGVVLSNSYFFENERNWTGILVEPDSQNAASCRANRPKSKTFECAAIDSPDKTEVSFFKVSGGEVYSTVNLIESHAQRLEKFGLMPVETKVNAKTLDQILRDADAGPIDFISIDVEEGELQVLRGFDICMWKPKLIMIESNAPDRDPSIRKYFTEHGYSYFHSISINHIYRPVLGGKLFAGLVDWFRYENASRLRTKTSLVSVLRRLLHRYVLWRFQR